MLRHPVEGRIVVGINRNGDPFHRLLLFSVGHIIHIPDAYFRIIQYHIY